jgi:glyoxylase-like metal-dependent hydrolase (beta-lactamase superfamily II)
MKMERYLNFNEIKCVKVSYTNCFLLKCSNGYLLIDASFPDTYKLFLKKLAKLNINISDINYLLLTHSHDDHTGFAAQLMKDTQLTIITHKNAVPYLEAGDGGDPILKTGLAKKGGFINSCGRSLIKLSSKLSNRDWKYNPVKLAKSNYIVDGDDYNFLNEIGIDGKILYTPGHTEDSISVLLSNGVAIIGDLAMNPLYFKICFNNYRPIWLQDIKEVYRSWNKIIDNGANIIYPAHGKPFNKKKLILTNKH